jgi:uncharacterized protein
MPGGQCPPERQGRANLHRTQESSSGASTSSYIHTLVLKSIRACNLRCKYCYYINDETRDYGKIINDKVLISLYTKFSQYLNSLNRKGAIVWHGGEPLMLGKRRFKRFLALQREIDTQSRIRNTLQTNALLIDDDWIDIFRENSIGFGISLDSSREQHDLNRVTASGRATYDDTVRIIEKLNLNFGILSVVGADIDGKAAIRNMRAKGITTVDFLLPMTNNARHRVSPVNLEHLSQFLCDAFWEWVKDDDPSLAVRLFSSMLAKALGQRPNYLATGGGRSRGHCRSRDGRSDMYGHRVQPIRAV